MNVQKHADSGIILHILSKNRTSCEIAIVFPYARTFEASQKPSNIGLTQIKDFFLFSGIFCQRSWQKIPEKRNLPLCRRLKSAVCVNPTRKTRRNFFFLSSWQIFENSYYQVCRFSHFSPAAAWIILRLRDSEKIKCAIVVSSGAASPRRSIQLEQLFFSKSLSGKKWINRALLNLSLIHI